MMQYRDDVKVVGPAKPIPGRGPLHPAFSPAYQQDGVLLVGGLQVSGARWAPSVFRCTGEVCSGSPLPLITTETPRVRPVPEFAESGIVVAFTTNGLFVSQDRGETFSELDVPWQAPLNDVAPAESGLLFAAVQGQVPDGKGDLYASRDGGVTWNRLDSPLLAAGVTSVRVSGSHVLAALHGGGVACSADGGQTWAARCPAA